VNENRTASAESGRGAKWPARVKRAVFRVPAGESEQFLLRWKDNARVMVGQPGFIRLRLLRSLGHDDEKRFINVADWAGGSDLKQGYANRDWQASMHSMLIDPASM
jgi:heme-degrading monooxygenase HmoA